MVTLGYPFLPLLRAQLIKKGGTLRKLTLEDLGLQVLKGNPELWGVEVLDFIEWSLRVNESYLSDLIPDKVEGIRIFSKDIINVARARFLHGVQFGKPSLVCDLMEPWRCMVETFILDYHDHLDEDCFTLHGRRSFLKPEPMHTFTQALDRHIDRTRIPYNYRDNSKTTRIRTAIKEEPKKLAIKLRKRNSSER